MMPPANVNRSTTRLNPVAAWEASSRPGLHAPPQPTHPRGADVLGVEVFTGLDALPLDIEHLFAQAERENISFGLSWYRNLVNAVYPTHNGLRLYVLRKNGRPVAALPVLTRPTALGQRIDALSNYYTATYAPVLTPEVSAHDLATLIEAVRNTHSPLGALQLSPLDPDSAAYQTLLGALRILDLPSFQFFCFGNWYLPVTSDWSSYLKTREGKLRSTLKRRGTTFATAGGTLELVLDGATLERGIAAFQSVYAASWKRAEPYPDFVPGLIRTCAGRGWLRLGIAWLNGEAIAAQIWIVANGKADIYKLAYDEKHKVHAAGTLLTAMLMQHVIDKDRVVEVDYLIGDDAYKQSWVSHRRERWGLVAYNPKSISGLLGLGREMLGRALKPSIDRLRTVVTKLGA